MGNPEFQFHCWRSKNYLLKCLHRNQLCRSLSLTGQTAPKQKEGKDMNTSTEVKAEQGNLVIIEKMGNGFSNQYQAHAEGCGDIERFLTRGFEVVYTGKSYIEFAMDNFSDLASDYLGDDDADIVWNAAVVREFAYYTPIKACCKTQVKAETAHLKNVEVNI
jgi:hypothetical protein